MLHMTNLNLMHLSSGKPNGWGRVKTPDMEEQTTKALNFVETSRKLQPKNYTA